MIGRIRERNRRAAVHTAGAAMLILDHLAHVAAYIKAGMQRRTLQAFKDLNDCAFVMETSANQLRAVAQLLQLHAGAHAHVARLVDDLQSNLEHTARTPTLRNRPQKTLKLPPFAFAAIHARTSSVVAPVLYTSARGPERITVHVRDENGEPVEWLVHKDIKVGFADAARRGLCARVRGGAGVFHIDLDIPMALRAQPLHLAVSVKGVLLRAWSMRREFTYELARRIECPGIMTGVFSIAPDASWMAYTRHDVPGIHMSCLAPFTYALYAHKRYAVPLQPKSFLITSSHTLIVCDGTSAVYEMGRSGAVLRTVCVAKRIEVEALALKDDMLAVGGTTERYEHDIHVYSYSTGTKLYGLSSGKLSGIVSLAFANVHQLIVSAWKADVIVQSLLGSRVDILTRCNRLEYSGNFQVASLENGTMATLDKDTKTVYVYRRETNAHFVQHEFGVDCAPKGLASAAGLLFVFVDGSTHALYVYQ